MTVIIDGTKGTTTPGLYSNSTFTGTYTDGIVVDYTTGTGRISVGTSDGLTIYNGGVASTSLMEITSGGNVGLGVTPSAWNTAYKALQIGSNGALFSDASAANHDALFLSKNAYYASGGWTYITSNEASNYYQIDGQHVWATAASGTAGNPVSFTQSLAVGKATTLALEGASSVSGTGISFPATQLASSDANTLDDYEEGTWTPVITFGGGTTGQTYGSQVGRYTKVGRLVTVQCYVLFTNKGSSTGGAAITGLPFTSDSSVYSAGAPWSNNLSLTAGYYLSVFNSPGTTNISLNSVNAGNVSNNVQNTNVNNNTDFMVTCSYIV